MSKLCLLAPLLILAFTANGCKEVELELPGEGKIVTLLELPAIQAPVYRGTPVTAITKTEEYTGLVYWTPDTPRFFAETVYTARIILIANYNYTFEGVKENSFIVPGAVATNAKNSGTITAVFPATGETTDLPISLLTISGIKVPKPGEYRSDTSIDTEQYYGTMSWSPYDYRFETDTVYTVRISLLDKEGWRLQGVEANSFIVPGAITTNKADSGEIKAVFPKTSSTMTISEIPAINFAVGAVPPAAITDTEQFTGTVSWTPNDAVFADDTEYTATITITAKDGWTTWGIRENFFGMSGAVVTNEENSSVVTALFSDVATITISEIPGIPVPVTGEAQTTPLIDTEQFTGTISWSPAMDIFASDTYFTANIELTAKDGWTFMGLPEDFFTVNGVTWVRNFANSNKVWVNFPRTEYIPSTITQLHITDIQVPVYGVKKLYINYYTDQYKYWIEWKPSLKSDSTFDKNTVYTAIIHITPLYGWTVTGLPENAFSVEGAVTTTYEAGAEDVIAVFPSTGE